MFPPAPVRRANRRICALQDSFGRTALHWVCKAGDERSAKELVSAGANVNAASTSGDSPLHWVCSAVPPSDGHHALAQFLLDSGADARQCNKAGQRPADVTTDEGLLGILATHLSRVEAQEQFEAEQAAERQRAAAAAAASAGAPRAGAASRGGRGVGRKPATGKKLTIKLSK